MINIVESTTFRKKDDVKILIRTAKAFVNRETMEIISELPEGADETEWAILNTQGRIRDNKTGKLYEIAHDVEDKEVDYIDMYPTPDSYCELVISNYGGTYYAHANTHVYPDYKAANTYKRGDIVVSSNREWILEVDELTGVAPNMYGCYGWATYLPYIEEREVRYATIEELNA